MILSTGVKIKNGTSTRVRRKLECIMNPELVQIIDKDTLLAKINHYRGKKFARYATKVLKFKDRKGKAYQIGKDIRGKLSKILQRRRQQIKDMSEEDFLVPAPNIENTHEDEDEDESESEAEHNVGDDNDSDYDDLLPDSFELYSIWSEDDNDRSTSSDDEFTPDNIDEAYDVNNDNHDDSLMPIYDGDNDISSIQSQEDNDFYTSSEGTPPSRNTNLESVTSEDDSDSFDYLSQDTDSSTSSIHSDPGNNPETIEDRFNLQFPEAKRVLAQPYTTSITGYSPRIPQEPEPQYGPHITLDQLFVLRLEKCMPLLFPCLECDLNRVEWYAKPRPKSKMTWIKTLTILAVLGLLILIVAIAYMYLRSPPPPITWWQYFKEKAQLLYFYM